MKTGLTLSAFAAKIEATAKSARDFILPASQLTMTPGGELAWTTKAEGHLFNANATANNQLATYCDIPKQYYDRCPSTLRSENVNHWLKQRVSDKRLVRVADGHVRGFLSDRYRPLDNYDLAAHVLPIISELGLQVESCDLTETKLYMKCIDPNLANEMNYDDTHSGIHRGNRDIVHPMIVIENSEVGHGSLSIRSGLFREVCKNGLVVETMVRKYHVGGKRTESDQLSEALEVYSEGTRKKMDDTLWAQVADITRSAISSAQFELIVSKVMKATEGPKIVKPDEACEVLRKRFSLTEIESSSILGHLAAGGDLSRWGMLNAVTRAAQDVESYDRSTELEKLGGTILDLAATDWAAIAK